ncbi:2-oxo-4-hydroxy-4-carboxy-5-ureidoimidazoline decarboxylase [Leucobacter albus]|uniref:2-oxo-4-hydroxy-4-carboxy-5-ureidoimidazoline decarboxylase n=1 Tax=Leucobacter albus TaxID=272210 RepID=A0ABW3TNF8_9MICO
MSLAAFNALEPQAAAELIRPCVDSDGWVTAVVAGRPYSSVDDALAAAETAAAGWVEADLDQALAHHPRIGDRAAGTNSEATMSRSEQAGVGLNSVTSSQMLAGNREYEQRFGRVFLIRAAGRSAAEILAELDRRLGNSPDQETGEAIEQLRQIALLRLRGVIEQ